MYTRIENDSFFDDIKSEKEKENFSYLVDYLCSMSVYKREDNIEIDGDYLNYHNYLANILYNEKNKELANKVLMERTKLYEESINYGASHIYELRRKYLLELGSMKYYYSIAILEHELMHIIPALNHNNPHEQHLEILSIFGEFLSLLELSKKEDNPLIYENAFINRCINMMSYRVYSEDFSDEYINNHMEWLFDAHKYVYPYMIGFIYATRLLNLYQCNEEVIKNDINEVLEGKYSLEDLLNKYNISLTDKDTIMCFENMCNYYGYLVRSKYPKTLLHSVRNRR